MNLMNLTKWKVLILTLFLVLISMHLLFADTQRDLDIAIEQSNEQEYIHLQKSIAERALNQNLLSNASFVASKELLILKSDRDPLDIVIRRTQALINAIEAMPEGKKKIHALTKQFVSLKTNASTVTLNKSTESQRYSLYKQACALRRKIALANPILNFDQIIYSTGTGYSGLYQTCPWLESNLVVKQWSKADWKNFNFNMPANEKGPNTGNYPGLYILSDFKTTTPKSRALFTSTQLKNGTFNGSLINKIPGEYHFAFDLSYDAKYVVFSKALTNRGAFHLFKAPLDESGCTQLTSSYFADWEPCILPNNRIAFISLRRWIAARCESWVPQACGTLYSMKDDGTDIFPISWHETSEMFPAVTSDGRICYSRWDYIDRDFSAGMHLWLCNADGTDPRAWHGNYPYPHSTLDQTANAPDGKRDRPWAEFHLRPLPNSSSKFIGIAGIHHGSTPGVPFIIDINVKDDNKMSQVKVLRGTKLPYEIDWNQLYNMEEAKFLTPWPLNEEFYIATRVTQNREIVLCDIYGNLEILAPSGGVSARPLQTRPTPANRATLTWQGERANRPDHMKATIKIANVYESDFDWPANTVIKAIRIIQLIPKPWCSGTEFRGSVGYSYGGLPRMVLGTVPVETDGSAYFEAPVEREILFQALDKDGLAVQSMRSGTYVHPGEQMSCTGCHEDKWKSTPVMPTRIAFKREPSKIIPDVSGSCPLTFARLLKPTLQNKCIPCHIQQKKGPTSAEYGNLRSYAFYFDADGQWNGLYPKIGGYRTTAGRFGAMESRMGKILMSTHQNRITPEELHRATLWLDCNSLELGAFHDATAQKEGKIVWPILDADSTNPIGVELSKTVPNKNIIYQTQRDFKSLISIRKDEKHLNLQNISKFDVQYTISLLNGRLVCKGYLPSEGNVQLKRPLKQNVIIQIHTESELIAKKLITYPL